MGVDDEAAARREVREAVWTWTGRAVVLLVAFLAGMFAGWTAWGAGELGAPRLRVKVAELEKQVRDLKNEREALNAKLALTTRDKETLERRLAALEGKALTGGAQP